MKKLRIVLAGVLLTLPLLSLDASPSVDLGDAAKVEQMPSVTGGWCYFYWNGVWYTFPC